MSIASSLSQSSCALRHGIPPFSLSPYFSWVFPPFSYHTFTNKEVHGTLLCPPYLSRETSLSPRKSIPMTHLLSIEYITITQTCYFPLSTLLPLLRTRPSCIPLERILVQLSFRYSSYLSNTTYLSHVIRQNPQLPFPISRPLFFLKIGLIYMYVIARIGYKHCKKDTLWRPSEGGLRLGCCNRNES